MRNTRLFIISAVNTLMLLLAINAHATATCAAVPYSDSIPDIDTVVKNVSVYVKLPSTWNLGSAPVSYTLQGYDSTTSKWVNVFGNGEQSNTLVSLSTSKATHISTVFPLFSGNSVMNKYRLLFMVKQGTGSYGMLGTIPVSGNEGSYGGNTYTLAYQSSGPAQLSPTVTSAPLRTPAHPPKISTSNGKSVFSVFNNRTKKYEPFYVRGMDYEPTPVGQPWSGGAVSAAPTEKVYLAEFNKNGGGQICTPLASGPYGQANQSYCFDTDMTGYMHQYLNNTALAGADAPNKLLPKMWARDLSYMQAMGINTIRIYHIDSLVRNMDEFLDMAYSYGIYVIMPAPAPNSSQTFANSPMTGSLLSWAQMTASSNGQPWSALMQLELAQYAAHPAILAWAVGNETDADNGHCHAAHTEWVLAKTIKQFSPDLLVTATNQDHYNAASNFEAYYNLFLDGKGGTYLDFYSINSYRGMNSTGLQLSGMQTLFDLHDGLSAPYNLPLLISEWGKYDTYDWGSFDNLWGFARLWRMFLMSDSNLLGAMYFEFSDEPVAKNLPEQHYMGVVASSLPADYPGTNKMVADHLVAKHKNYAGIKIEKADPTTHKITKYQDYAAVNQAGVFDSFIGDNSNSLIKDPDIPTVPNIAYCAFNQSGSPWNINANCLKLDASAKTVGAYTIQVNAAGGDSITSLTLNGSAIRNGSSNTETGVIEIKLSGKNKNSGWVKVGFSSLQQMPKESTNTILGHHMSGSPNVVWSPGGITISLAPVQGGK